MMPCGSYGYGRCSNWGAGAAGVIRAVVGAAQSSKLKATIRRVPLLEGLEEEQLNKARMAGEAACARASDDWRARRRWWRRFNPFTSRRATASLRRCALGWGRGGVYVVLFHDALGAQGKSGDVFYVIESGAVTCTELPGSMVSLRT